MRPVTYPTGADVTVFVLDGADTVRSVLEDAEALSNGIRRLRQFGFMLVCDPAKRELPEVE